MDQDKREEEKDDLRERPPGNMLLSVVNRPATRREFLKVAGVGSASVLAATLVSCTSPLAVSTTSSAPTTTAPKPTVYVPNAKMMVLQEPSKCVGCRRCEVACTAFHDNKIQPAISRVKISRNFNFGPDGPRLGMDRGPGLVRQLPPHRGDLPAVPAPGAVHDFLPGGRHRRRLRHRRQGDRRSQMHRMWYLHKGVPVADDLTGPGGKESHQVRPLRRRSAVREDLSFGGPLLCTVARPDQGYAFPAGGACLHWRPGGGGSNLCGLPSQRRRGQVNGTRIGG